MAVQTSLRHVLAPAALVETSASSSSGKQSSTRARAGFSAAAALASTALAGTAFADTSVQQPTLKNPLILYQYQVCPWCCKVKAVMDFHNVPYKAVEVNPVWKEQLKFSEYKKVPVLITTDGEQLNESNVIIDYLMQLVVQQPAATKKGWFKGAKPAPGGAEEEQRWREWVDTKFVQLITANIYSSFGQAAQSMAYISSNGNWSSLEKGMAYSLGTLAMYVVGMRMPKKYGFDGDLRALLYEAADSFVEAVGDRDFLGGAQPNLADLAVFGVVRAVQDTDTFYDLLEHSKLKPWWFRMIETVGESSQVTNSDL